MDKFGLRNVYVGGVKFAKIICKVGCFKRLKQMVGIFCKPFCYIVVFLSTIYGTIFEIPCILVSANSHEDK